MRVFVMLATPGVDDAIEEIIVDACECEITVVKGCSFLFASCSFWAISKMALILSLV